MNTNEREILDLIRKGENLTVEFKSDRKKLPDSELVAAVVALANTEGGILLIGVEDDGAISGQHRSHQDTRALAALIANRTNPSIMVAVEQIRVQGLTVALIRVSKSRQLVSTSDGLMQRRRLMANGKPEAVPFYPA